MKIMQSSWLVLVLGVATFGCGGDDDKDTAAPLEIVGEWSSDFGDEAISETSWETEFGALAIIEYDNDANLVITQNPDGDDDFANTFSRTVFTEPENDSFSYCTTDFGLETLEEARASTLTANESDLQGTGCGGFAWTTLTKK